jgi:NADH-quinone oxidoreductase subunit C
VKLSVRMPRENPQVQSVALVWTTAEWGERETYDFYGIDFVDHPDLRRILLPEDWEGWPLRKDYQMPSRYHDVPLEGMPYAVREEL